MISLFEIFIGNEHHRFQSYVRSSAFSVKTVLLLGSLLYLTMFCTTSMILERISDHLLCNQAGLRVTVCRIFWILYQANTTSC